MVSQIEKVAMKSMNHFIEEADGNMREARRLFYEWVGEMSPKIGVDNPSYHSWVALILAIEYAFKDAAPASEWL